MSNWKADARKAVRGSMRAGMSDAFDCRFASASSVLARRGGAYGVVTVQTSTTSSPDSWVFYVNFGVGSDAWLAARGFGPKTPKSDVDCAMRERLTPNENIFGPSEFDRFSIHESDWNQIEKRATFLQWFEVAGRDQISLWMTGKMAD